MSSSTIIFGHHVENGVKHLDTRIVTKQTTVKRKRGRPQKTDQVKKSEHELWEELRQQQQLKVNKKKRGRPQNSNTTSVTQQHSDDDDDEEESVKVSDTESVMNNEPVDSVDNLVWHLLQKKCKDYAIMWNNISTTSVTQQHSDDDEKESVKGSDTESVMNNEPVDSVDNHVWHLLQKLCKDHAINLTWYLPEFNRRLRLDMEREIRRLARLAPDSELPDHGSVQEGMYRYHPELSRMVEILYPPHKESECAVIEDRGKAVVVGWTNNPRFMEQTFILKCARDYEPDFAGFVAKADAQDNDDNDNA